MSATAQPVEAQAVYTESQGVTYMTQPYPEGAQVTYAQPETTPQYVDENGQPVVYVDENGNPVDPNAGAVQYVDENGNPVDMGAAGGEVQYVDENGQPVDVNGNPIQYVDENGNPVSMAPQYAPAQPAVFNVPPEIFAKLAAGGTLTEDEMATLTGGAAPAAPEITSASASPSPAGDASGSKKKKKSKKALSSKKSKKGCC